MTPSAAKKLQTSSTANAIKISGITAGYGHKNVIKDITFDVHTGETFGLIGLNGVGKTTLIKIILGLMEASSGSITLDFASGQVVAGLSYSTTIKTLRPNIESTEGLTQGQRISIVSTNIRVYNSARPTVNGNISPSRSFGDDLDTATPLVTGDLEYMVGGWDNLGQLTIASSDPLPLMVLGIFSTAEAGVR